MASLKVLNETLLQRNLSSVPMDRFRANIVVGSDRRRNELQGFAEDRWAQIRIGDTTFQFESMCKRCVIITTDQTTAIRDARTEPLRTLADIHQDGIPYFGINMVHRLHGPHHVIRVGDEVEILQTF